MESSPAGSPGLSAATAVKTFSVAAALYVWEGRANRSLLLCLLSSLMAVWKALQRELPPHSAAKYSVARNAVFALEIQFLPLLISSLSLFLA